MISARRRWLAAAALVGVGWLVTPQPVAVYDGIGAPDEPYRYVAPPPGVARTAEATTAVSVSPVKDGVSTNGMSVSTAEMSPQFSLFVPPKALGCGGTSVQVKAEPRAATDQPAGARIDGNVYVVSFLDPAGPVTLTDKAAVATLYLRSTTNKQPPPSMEYRPTPTDPWKPLKTTRGGQDVYVSAFPGPGEYSLAFATSGGGGGGGVPVLPIVLVAGLVLLVVAVVVVRVRSQGSSPPGGSPTSQ